MNDIELYLNQNKTKSCSEMIFSYIDDYFIKNNIDKDSCIYNKANIDRRIFSKFRYGNYNLSKNNILKLCIALELNLDEVNQVLESAGYSLSMNKDFDLILRYFISNKIFDFQKINDCLFTYTNMDLSQDKSFSFIIICDLILVNIGVYYGKYI